MPDTGTPAFDTTIDKTNRILNELEQANGWSKQRRHQSYAAVRAVLHALRERLTVEEGAHLSAQLPMILRGVFYEGWNPARLPVKMRRDEFLARVQQEFPFEVDGGMERLVQTVVQVLGHHMTPGEWEDVRAAMPKDLASLLTPAATSGLVGE